jgi:hypothetical protein
VFVGGEVDGLWEKQVVREEDLLLIMPHRNETKRI